jgi:GTP-binding protein
MFGASEDPLHALVLERGQRAMPTRPAGARGRRREGWCPAIARLRDARAQADRPLLLAINKMDDKSARAGALDFYQLGFDPVFEISAEHGRAWAICSTAFDRCRACTCRSGRAPRRRAPTGVARPPPDEVGIAIVAGPTPASRLSVNRLLREERMIVSECPDHARLGGHRAHLAQAPVPHRRHGGHPPAGRGGASGQVESVSVLLARRSIESADIVVLVVDAAAGPPIRTPRSPARPTAGQGRDHRRQQVGPDEGAGADFVKLFDEAAAPQLKFLDYAPILHVSACHRGARAEAARGDRPRRGVAAPRVKTHQLNTLVEKISRPIRPEPGAAPRSHSLRGADQRGAAHVRVLHQRRRPASTFRTERYLVNSCARPSASRARHPHPGGAAAEGREEGTP